jgi:hypothetical protein
LAPVMALNRSQVSESISRSPLRRMASADGETLRSHASAAKVASEADGSDGSAQRRLRHQEGGREAVGAGLTGVSPVVVRAATAKAGSSPVTSQSTVTSPSSAMRARSRDKKWRAPLRDFDSSAGEDDATDTGELTGVLSAPRARRNPRR